MWNCVDVFIFNILMKHGAPYIMLNRFLFLFALSMSTLKHEVLNLTSQCLLWCETVWTVAVTASLISNFRDSVSSINQILNQMCEDGYSEQFRTVKQAQLQTCWLVSAHTAYYMQHGVGTGSREIDTEPWTHKIQGLTVYGRHVSWALTPIWCCPDRVSC